MIEPGAINSIIKNTLNQTGSRERAGSADERKSSKTETDSVETSAAREGERPKSEPISGREEANSISSLLGEQIVGSPGAAFSAQTGLDPEAVLSLIA
ncbi:MAG: hypothetical protein QNK37_17250 [Acidobacteriota bacterium]|nr:hypothetical protein [Acidobacteriota bacterium]